MLHVVGHSWWQSLAALTLAGVFGFSDAVVRADPPPAELAVVGAVQEKEGEKAQADKRRDDKGKKSPESLDELRERLKQLEDENAKLREALGQHKTGADFFKKSQEKPAEGDSKKIQGVIIKHKPQESSDKAHASDGKKDAPEEPELKLKQMRDEIARLNKAGRTQEAEKLAGLAKELNDRLTKQGEAKALDKHESVLPSDEQINQVLEQLRKDLASGITEEAARLQSQLNELRRKRALEMSEFLKAQAGDDKNDDPSSLLQDLRKEVSRLRDEVAELRRMVKEQERTPKK